MELEFNETGRIWLEAMQVSIDRVQETVHSPTRHRVYDVGNLKHVIYCRWFSDDMAILVGGLGTSVQGSSHGKHIKQLKVDMVMRVARDCPIPNVSPEMECDDLLNRICVELGKEVSKAEMDEIVEGRVRLPAGYMIHFPLDTDRGDRVVLTLDAYRKALFSGLRRRLALPAVSEFVTNVPKGVDRVDHLRAKTAEFLRLLDSAKNEEQVHQWLCCKEHWLFLDPYAIEIKSKVRLVGRDTDFVIRRSDDTYVLVEIERANAQLFKQDGHPAHDLNQAIGQVKSWQDYIRESLHTVRVELPEISQPLGIVILGRTNDFDRLRKPKERREARRRWKSMKSEDPCPYTYDEIAKRVDALAEQLSLLPD